jgi:hypothetical protein
VSCYRAIIEKSGFLDKINPGDLILADRGFTIEALLIARQASLNIPPFLVFIDSITHENKNKHRIFFPLNMHYNQIYKLQVQYNVRYFIFI